jgi:transposase
VGLEGAPRRSARRRRVSKLIRRDIQAEGCLSEAYASLEPGVNISALARSLEITPSQLIGWRGAAAKRAAKAELRMNAEPSGAKARRVEIEIGGAVLRVPADIGEDDLRRLVRAVREA